MSKHNLPKHNPSFVILTSSTHAALVMWLLSWLCQQKCYLCTWTEKCFETLINRVVEAFAGLLNYLFFCIFSPGAYVYVQHIRNSENKPNKKTYRGIKQWGTMYMSRNISHTTLMTWISLLRSFLPIHILFWVDNVSSWWQEGIFSS